MIVSDYALVGLVALIVVGAALLAAALWRPPARPLRLPPAWAQHRFGFVTYALHFEGRQVCLISANLFPNANLTVPSMMAHSSKAHRQLVDFIRQLDVIRTKAAA